MGRLIDTDDLKEIFQNLKETGTEQVRVDDVLKYIDEQQTAYDLESVEKQLGDMKDMMAYSAGCKTPLKRAEEVVKAGRVNKNLKTKKVCNLQNSKPV